MLKRLLKRVPGLKAASQTVDRHFHLLGRELQTLQQIYVQQRLAEPRYRDPRHLNRCEHQILSQQGEDGIIAEIFRRIGVTDRFFVEIGAGDGLMNNTGALLVQGWCGVWVEGDAHHCQVIREQLHPLITSDRLRLVEAFVTRENINELLNTVNVPIEFDLLSLDIDYNTYWIWDSLKHLRPRVVIVEYNALWPPPIEWVVPYERTAIWDQSLMFGASLSTYEHLAGELGYGLVACDLSGINAFFVRQDCLGDAFVGPFDAATHYQSPAYFLVPPSTYGKTFAIYSGGR